ncbi:MAG: SDR family oxidoreductase [Chloroflexota bacterium]
MAVFGGTGKTGQHVVRQALDAGYQVTALVRTRSKMTLEHPNLSLVEGDVLSSSAVEAVVRSADAVISVLGPSNNKPEFTISRGMELILKVMKQQNVQRLIVSTGAGVREAQDKPKFVDRLFGVLLGVLSKNVVADMRATVARIKASDRNWTIVRVPMLTDQPAQGRVKTGYVGDISPRLSRADMAAFILEQVKDNRFSKQAPAISN